MFFVIFNCGDSKKAFPIHSTMLSKMTQNMANITRMKFEFTSFRYVANLHTNRTSKIWTLFLRMAEITTNVTFSRHIRTFSYGMSYFMAMITRFRTRKGIRIRRKRISTKRIFSFHLRHFCRSVWFACCLMNANNFSHVFLTRTYVLLVYRTKRKQNLSIKKRHLVTKNTTTKFVWTIIKLKFESCNNF